MKIMFRTFISVFIVYLIFTPIFFMYNFYAPDWIFIFICITRFIAIVLLGIWYRRKNINIITISGSKFAYLFILSCLAIWILLQFMGVQEKVFGALASALDIYNVGVNSPFFLILFEQLLNSYLLTNFLICLGIVFLKLPLHKSKQN